MSAPVTESQVLDALRPIEDPAFKKSIVDLGFIKDLTDAGGRVSIAIELTSPACSVKAECECAASERDAALEEIRTQTVELAVDIARKIVGETFGPETHKRLVEEYLREFPKAAQRTRFGPGP